MMKINREVANTNCRRILLSILCPCHDNFYRFYRYLEGKGMLIESIFSQLTLDKNSIDPETSSLLSIYPLV